MYNVVPFSYSFIRNLFAGDRAGRFFTVSTGGVLHVQNLTLVHGLHAGNAGAVYVEGASSVASFLGCVLQGNEAKSAGGAIYIGTGNPSVTITESTLRSNSAGTQ